MRLLIVSAVLCCTLVADAQQGPLPDEVVITYITQNKPLKVVLKELAEKSGVPISFVPNRIPGNSKVSINAVNQPLGIILKAILSKRRCKYDIIGNQIVVSRSKLRDKDRDLTISGYLTDKKSGELLIGSNVYLFDKSKGTQTNEDGFYSFTMNKGSKRIYYSYLGYEQVVKEIFLQQDTIMNIELDPDVELNEIIILDDIENQEEPQTISESKLHLDRIRTASSLGGEVDVIRLVALMPGVESGADGVGGINVRGGSADQNLVLLDGVPIYNSGHALGIFSVFNSSIIKNASLIKGNIPARYGGRLSSILDIKTRDGNKKRFAGDVSLSILAAKGSIEGPIGKNGSSFILSGRRTFVDPWIKLLTSQNNDSGKSGFSNYYFSDFNAKLNLKLNKRHTLYISGFLGNDKFETERVAVETNNTGALNTISTGTDWDWGNRLFSIKLTSQYSQKSFGRLLAYYTKYDFDSFEYDDFESSDSTMTQKILKAGYFKSAIDDLSIKYDFDYIPNTSHVIRAGVGATHHNFSPGLVSLNNSDNVFPLGQLPTKGVVRLLINDPVLTGQEYFGYVEDEISLGYGSTINVGLHANFTKTGEQSYTSLQPRISFLSKWEGSFFKVGVSRMNQYLHLLSNNGLGLPTDVWLPSTDKLGPEKSWIATMGFGYYTSSGIRAGIEGYYKIFDELTTYDEGGINEISESTDWENDIPVGKGTAYGIEVYFDKIIGRTNWNLNYSLAYAFREFDGLTVDDEPYPFRYNRRHNIKLGFLHKITDNTEFTLNWNLSSGNPITKPSGSVIPVNGVLTPIYTEKNGGRLPTYHRVDVGFNFYSEYKWGRMKIFIGAYNAFNKSNPFYVDIENTVADVNNFQLLEYSIFPIIPSAGVSLSF